MLESNEHAATELADAAIQCVKQQGQSETHFDDFFASLKPSAETIARAMSIVTFRVPGFSAAQTLLNAYLQTKLMQEHVSAQGRMTRLTTWLTVVIAALTIVQVLPQIQPQGVSISRRLIMLHIPFAGMHIAHWIYLGLAVIFSLIYGLAAFQIHGEFKQKAEGWQRWHQKWFNGVGAAVGWIAGWVVLVRWLGCKGYVCHDEPTGWTILLAVLAFIGITGHLPLTIVKAITELRALLAKLTP